MYQPFQSIDVHRNIKSYSTAALIFYCIIGFFIFLISSAVILALIPLYLPMPNFILPNLDNNTVPIRSNLSNVLIDTKNWPLVEQTVQHLLNSKVNNIHFTNTSDVRIVDSTTWCNTNGCLRVFGKIIFSIDCPFSCQSRKMNQLDTLNLIEPSIKINLNSTMNISYTIELDGFTIVISEGEENGDQIKMFLIYNLIENHNRAYSSLIIPVDNSSLINITHLITNSIIQSHMNINEFVVIQAEINIELSLLNVSTLFTFNIKCTNDCQQIQINKLVNRTLTNLDPIVISYDGKIHVYNISFMNVFVVTTTTEFISDTKKSMFEVNYRLEPVDLLLGNDLEVGSITDNSTLHDLTNMMQTTVTNNSDIIVFVFNATIEIANTNTTARISPSDSITYLLRLIVYYIYPITCNECIQICNEAIYHKPQLSKSIQIRNATLRNISRPISVINLTPNPITTIIPSLSTASTVTNLDKTSTHSITSQNQITEHTSTIHSSTEHSTTHHTTEYSSTIPHSTEHTSTHPYTTSHHTTD